MARKPLVCLAGVRPQRPRGIVHLDVEGGEPKAAEDDRRPGYQALKDEEAQKSFLLTRGYLRLCQKVMSGALPPLDLPNMPRAFDYDDVTKAEQNIVEDALKKSIGAEIEAAEPKR